MTYCASPDINPWCGVPTTSMVIATCLFLSRSLALCPLPGFRIVSTHTFTRTAPRSYHDTALCSAMVCAMPHNRLSRPPTPTPHPPGWLYSIGPQSSALSQRARAAHPPPCWQRPLRGPCAASRRSRTRASRACCRTSGRWGRHPPNAEAAPGEHDRGAGDNGHASWRERAQWRARSRRRRHRGS